MSCSGRNAKNRFNKSCVRYYNNIPQPVTADESIQLQIVGAKVVDSGISIEAENLSYNILKAGLYHFSGDVIINTTTPGIATLQMYMDGVPLPCTAREVTCLAGNTQIHTETDLWLTGCCCDIDHSFTFILTSDAVEGNVVEFCSGVTKIAS